MKRVLCLLLLTSYLFAGELEDNNLRVRSETKKGNQIETVIGNGKGMEIVVRSTGPLTASNERLIVKTYKTFYNWDEFDIRAAEMVFEGKSLSIIFLLNKLVYKGINIAPYLPSGIQLYYETFYEYDFRMFKDSLFMRLKGQYYSKGEFLDELYNAVNDPLLYIQTRDPSYIIRQIDELRTTNNEQSKFLHQLDERNLNLLDQHEALLEQHQALVERHDSLLSDFETLLENHNNLQTAYNQTVTEKDLLTDGVLSLANRSFFGSLGVWDRTIVDKVIELKTATPAMTVKECAAAIKAEGLKVANKTIEAVYIVYFGEFPQNPTE